MRKKGYLLIAGSLNFFIATLHIMTIFIGAPAYYFLDAPQLAVYTELGFLFPAWLSFFVTLGFIICGLYAFCAAGSKIILPFQDKVLKVIGSLYLLRGLGLFWYCYQLFLAPTDSSLKEIVFSIFALIIGFLYWFGMKQKSSPQEI